MGQFREAIVLTLMLASVAVVGQVHPLINPVQQVVDAGLMSRSADGSFRAEETITRAELATILVRAFDVEQRRGWHVQSSWQTTAIQDVSPLHWAYLKIQSVIQTGVMTTYAGDRFMPDQTVTRAEGFAAIAQAYGGKTPTPERTNAILKAYSDSDSIPAWARPSIAVVASKGWVNVKHDFRIAPEEPLTRGDIARALSVYLNQQPPTRPPLNRTSAEMPKLESILQSVYCHPIIG